MYAGDFFRCDADSGERSSDFLIGNFSFAFGFLMYGFIGLFFHF
jgi:hypothetical protein